MPGYLPNKFESFQSCIKHAMQPELLKAQQQN